MPSRKTAAMRGCLGIFTVSIVCALIIGALPALLIYSVDPYEVMGPKVRPRAISELAEKAHYPMWKLARYRPGEHETVILGDSRARALREKYWREAGLGRAINLAYGGGTVPEIYTTFELIKDDPAVRNIVVGIQLRSMDERHKGGMNRVPEAIRVLNDRLEYLKNWSVAKTSLTVFRAENAEAIETLSTFVPSLVSSARAEIPGREGATSLHTLLSPEICFSCSLPRSMEALPLRVRHGRFVYSGLLHGSGDGYGGRWRQDFADELLALYRIDLQARSLPAKIQRQVERNGPADWRDFEMSELYWRMLEDMASSARENGKRLIFVIPPTVTDMQATIARHGLADLNLALRFELAKLAEVIDFDFPNSLTSDPENFSDAYHFGSNVARAMVEELAERLSPDGHIRRKSGLPVTIDCIDDPAAGDKITVGEDVSLTGGRHCRSWFGRSR